MSTFFCDSSAPAGGDGGSPGSAFTSPGSLSLSNGDQVRLKKGSVFTAQLLLDTLEDIVVDAYEDPDNPNAINPVIFVDSGTDGILIDNCKNVTIRNLQSAGNSDGFAIQGRCENIWIQGCTSSLNNANGFHHKQGAGSANVAGGDVTLRDCVTWSNTNDGFSNRGTARMTLLDCIARDLTGAGSAGDGATTHDTSSMIMKRCTFRNCRDGFDHTGTGEALLIDCTFEDILEDCIGLEADCPITIRGCTFLNNSATVDGEICGVCAPTSGSQTITVEGSKFIGLGWAIAAPTTAAPSASITVNVTGCFFVGPPAFSGSGNQQYFINMAADNTVNVFNNVFVTYHSGTSYAVRGNGTLNAKNNLFMTDNLAAKHHFRVDATPVALDISNNHMVTESSNGTPYFNGTSSVNLATFEGLTGVDNNVENAADPTRGDATGRTLDPELYRVLKHSYAYGAGETLAESHAGMDGSRHSGIRNVGMFPITEASDGDGVFQQGTRVVFSKFLASGLGCRDIRLPGTVIRGRLTCSAETSLVFHDEPLAEGVPVQSYEVTQTSGGPVEIDAGGKYISFLDPANTGDPGGHVSGFLICDSAEGSAFQHLSAGF